MVFLDELVEPGGAIGFEKRVANGRSCGEEARLLSEVFDRHHYATLLGVPNPVRQGLVNVDPFALATALDRRAAPFF